MQVLTKEAEKDNGRIGMLNMKRKGYIISELETYPKDGNHMKCYTNLPCKVIKGLDNFKDKKKWYVIFDDNISIQDKKYSNVHLAMDGAINDYLKYLEKQIKDIKNGNIK